MKLTPYLFIFNFIFLLPSRSRLLSSSSSGGEKEAQEQITYEGPCEMNTAPREENECFQRTNHTYSCCFAEIKNESEDTHDASQQTFCFGVDTSFIFAPHFVKEIQIDNNIKNANLTCRYEPKTTCSRANPEILEDCRLHGSGTTSCCKITLLDKETNCILSNKLIGIEKNYTILGNLVECTSLGLYYSIKILLITLLILFI